MNNDNVPRFPHKTVEYSKLASMLVAAGCAAPLLAQAQKIGGYPERPIRIIVGNVAGGALDAVTRAAGRKITDHFGQSVVIDNRPGAGSAISLDLAAQATADGYTLLGASDTLILLGVLKRVAYDVRKAFVPVVQMSSQMYVMAVTPSLPPRTVKELIAYAQKKPGALSYGSQGSGSNGNIGMERFKLAAGIDMTHVPYKGAPPALLDILAGRLDLMFAGTISSATHVRSGKLRALAVSGLRRANIYPDVPTIAESALPGFEVVNKYALFAPAGTPPAIISALNEIVSRGMNAPDIAKWLAADGSEPSAPATPAEFRNTINKDYEKLESIIARLNLGAR